MGAEHSPLGAPCVGGRIGACLLPWKTAGQRRAMRLAARHVIRLENKRLRGDRTRHGPGSSQTAAEKEEHALVVSVQSPSQQCPARRAPRHARLLCVMQRHPRLQLAAQRRVDVQRQ